MRLLMLLLMLATGCATSARLPDIELRSVGFVAPTRDAPAFDVARENLVRLAEHPAEELRLGDPLPTATTMSGPTITGHTVDLESGLTYAQARYLDASTGRFLSLDPVAGSLSDPFSTQGYTYMSSAPTSGVDPDGMRPRTVYEQRHVDKVENVIAQLRSIADDEKTDTADRKRARRQAYNANEYLYWHNRAIDEAAEGQQLVQHRTGDCGSEDTAYLASANTFGTPTALNTCTKYMTPAEDKRLTEANNKIDKALRFAKKVGNLLLAAVSPGVGRLFGAAGEAAAVEEATAGARALRAASVARTTSNTAKVATEFSGAAGRGPKLLTSDGPRRFVGDAAIQHFEKHSGSVMKALGKSEYNLADYLDDANHVIQTGTWVPELNGYVRLVGGQGSAKAAFVGVDRAAGSITTFHIKTVKELSRSAPSLGWSP